MYHFRIILTRFKISIKSLFANKYNKVKYNPVVSDILRINVTREYSDNPRLNRRTINAVRIIIGSLSINCFFTVTLSPHDRAYT